MSTPFSRISPARLLASAAGLTALPTLAFEVQHDSIIRRATVKIDPQGSSGSGVIVKAEGNRYTVLTAAHVPGCKGENSDEISIVTWDGERHTMDQGSLVCPPPPSSQEERRGLCVAKEEEPWLIDLALLSFTSNTSYPSATRRTDIDRNGIHLIVAGFPKSSSDLSVFKSQGPVSPPPASLGSTCQGYGLRYVAPTAEGMSGGGLWTEKGQLAGIHGYRIQTNAQGLTLSQGSYSAAIPVSYWLGMANPWKLELNDRQVTALRSGDLSQSTSNTRDLISQAQNLLNRMHNKASGDESVPTLALEKLRQAREVDQQQPLIPGMESQIYLFLYKKSQRPELLASALQAANDAITLSRKWAGSYDGRFEKIRAEIHSLRGFPDKALIDINIRLERVPTDVSALKDKAKYEFQANNYQGALNTLNQVLTLNHEDPSVLVDRGLIFATAGMKSQACSDWNTAIEIANALSDKGGAYEQDASLQINRANEYRQSVGCF